jgi:protein-disulfide isomerase
MVKSSRVKVSSVDIIEKQSLTEPKGWDVYFVNIHADVKKSPTETDKINVPETVFVKDGYAAPSLINIKTGADYKKDLRPKLKADIYDPKHLIAGNKDAKHKLVIFSDPQCPFCQDIIPNVYKSVKENPKEVALYYYHLPLGRLHPAAPTVSRLMLVAKKKGVADIELKTYKGKDYFKYDERDEDKIIRAFNKVMKTDIKKEELHTKEIEDELKEDKKYIDELMINGTPTIYVDGKKDNGREKYKKILGIK